MNAENTVLGTSGKTALVHKMDAEGSILIDAITGQVLPGQHERPEWAENLALALLAERHAFYNTRLGPTYADQHKSPEAFAYEDLGWIGVDEEGEEVELAADEEYRMNVLAKVTGIDRDTGDMGQVVAEHDIYRDNSRTENEAKALEESQDTGFGSVKTGTHG